MDPARVEEKNSERRVFVGGLPTHLPLDQIEREILRHLPPPDYVEFPKDSKRRWLSRGYAFLKYSDQGLMQSLDGSIVDLFGRNVQLCVSGGEGDQGITETLQKRVRLLGLLPEISDEDLTQEFRKYCQCVAAYHLRDHHGNPKGSGYMMLGTKEEALRVTSLKKFIIQKAIVWIEQPTQKKTRTPLESFTGVQKFSESEWAEPVQNSAPRDGPILKLEASNEDHFANCSDGEDKEAIVNLSNLKFKKKGNVLPGEGTSQPKEENRVVGLFQASQQIKMGVNWSLILRPEVTYRESDIRFNLGPKHSLN